MPINDLSLIRSRLTTENQIVYFFQLQKSKILTIAHVFIKMHDNNNYSYGIKCDESKDNNNCTRIK